MNRKNHWFRDLLRVVVSCGGVAIVACAALAQVGSPTFCVLEFEKNCAQQHADTTRQCHPGGGVVECPDVIDDDDVDKTHPSVRSVHDEEQGRTMWKTADLVYVTIMVFRCNENEQCVEVGIQEFWCQGKELDYEHGEECGGSGGAT